MFKLVSEKAEAPEINCWIIEKARESRKTPISALLIMPKPLTVWITINWKILKEMGKRWDDLPLEKPICRSASNS